MDKIFLFDADDIKGGYLFYSATDSHGVAVSDSEEKELDKVFVKYDKKGKFLTDRLFSIGNDLLVSRRLLDLLKEAKHQECRVINALVSIGKEMVNDNYRLVLPQEPIDILDYNKAEVKKYKQFVLSVRKWVADRNKLPNLDLFYAKPNSWIITEKLKKEIESKNYSGNDFEEIEIV